MRNPWGYGEWKGDWSDSSDKWTPELMKECDHKIANDGIFWMTPEDFVTIFRWVAISKIKPSYKYTSTSFNDPFDEKVSTKFIRMTVKQKSHIYLGINQKDKRHFKNSPHEKNYKYSRTRVLVGFLEDNDDEVDDFICAGTAVDRNTFAEAVFEPGKYLISVQIAWRQDLDHFWSVSAYGESMVDLEIVDNLTEQIGEVVADHFYHYFKKVDSNAIKNPKCKRHEY